MPDRTTLIGAEALAAAVGDLLDPLYVSLEALAAEIVRCRRAAGAGGFTERSLASFENVVAARLAVHPAMAGAGYLAEPGIITGQDRYLLWWQRAGDDELARLRLNFDASSVDIYDYLQMEFFQLARDGGARNAFGPHVDYSGSGLYVLTATVPVLAEGVFLGAAGADISMSLLERELVAVLRTGAAESVVVNAERRVIAANSPDWVVGSRLSGQPVAGDGSFVEVASVPRGPGWLVAVTDRPLAH